MYIHPNLAITDKTMEQLENKIYPTVDTLKEKIGDFLREYEKTFSNIQYIKDELTPVYLSKIDELTKLVANIKLKPGLNLYSPGENHQVNSFDYAMHNQM